ncbi:methyltransferase domain-containing protein [Sphingomonas koreensis]|nr:methyltransferase domain-containing protein [Sphingomonas koreensis]
MIPSSKKDKEGWHGRWIALRNRVLADSGFQRFAARFPFTRPIARRRARALFDLVAGFTYSQTLVACVETGLLDLLADAPLDTDTVARLADFPPESADRLLRAATAIGLVERLGTRWALGADGAALRGNRGIAEMVAHHHLLYADLADPVAMLRRGGGGGALSDYWRYAESSGSGTDAEVAAYSTLMAASQPLIAEQVIQAYRFDRHRRMLDVGGGEGAFLAAVGAAAPALALSLFDLPAVGARAKGRLAAHGFESRATIYGGDFLADALPDGHDIISLVRVLHDHDDAAAMVLLRAIRAAMPPGGTLLIAEPMAQTRGAEPAGDAYFGLYLLAMGSGRPRSPREIAAMLRAAGFARSRLLPTAMPLTARVIVATV